ncbi:hypothetical protein [Nostoc sp. NMS9]|uniref:hypothetical protein n=1 Tax=Nostoc sp. NMS9 TaxID=2815393 RepID=UPI0025E1DA41|nr:hypothetical protein [Nostoc sp. NMS9]MBN3938830.1 hypothetical protein [Nostoc sp. NMS9]
MKSFEGSNFLPAVYGLRSLRLALTYREFRAIASSCCAIYLKIILIVAPFIACKKYSYYICILMKQ